MNAPKMLFAVLIVCAGFRSLASADIITIHDQSFTPGTWTASILGGTNVTSASISRLIGQGVTGNAQQTTINGSGSYTFDVQHFKLDRQFNTNVDGIMRSVSWEIWYKVENSSQFAGWRLAARQGGDTFIAGNTYFEPQLFSPFWQRATGSVMPTDFGRVTGSGNPTLDTSVGGQPIEFGYVLSRGVFLSGTTRYRASFLNLDITTVPEPSSFAMMAGLVVLLPLGIRGNRPNQAVNGRRR